MPLPKISQPLFQMTVPSTGDKINYRPFTVKEEKILLIAQESNDIDQVVLSIKQILGNCIQDYDIEKLAVFDLEYILLQIRAKAVNNELKFKIIDPETEEEVEVELDVNDIEIVRSDKHSKMINVTDDIVLKMRYPTIDFIRSLQSAEDNQQEALFGIMKSCIEAVVEGEQVYKMSDFTDEEVDSFLDSLDARVINSVRDFFDTIPKMKYEVKYHTKDGTEKTFVAEGTETFFI
jgi:hypothetical protein